MTDSDHPQPQPPPPHPARPPRPLRILAIDLGDQRTGLAVTDTITRIVSPVGVIEVPAAQNTGAALLDALAVAIQTHLGSGPARLLLIGLPLNMDGTEGPRAKIVRAFADRIAQRTGLPIAFQDERLSTVAADWAMARSGLTRGQKKQRRDALAAASILSDYISSLGPS